MGVAHIYSFSCILNFQIHLTCCLLYDLPSHSKPPSQVSSGEVGSILEDKRLLTQPCVPLEGCAAAELSHFLFPVKYVISYPLSFIKTHLFMGIPLSHSSTDSSHFISPVHLAQPQRGLVVPGDYRGSWAFREAQCPSHLNNSCILLISRRAMV